MEARESPSLKFYVLEHLVRGFVVPEINRDSPSKQIADQIRQAIDDGNLKAGDKAPTTRDIVDEYGVAIATAHRVLKTLQAEGYLVARSGRSGGSFVTSEQERSRTSAQHTEKAIRTGRVCPKGHHARVIDAGLTEASEQIAAALGVEAGAPVICRRRVRLSAEEEPLAYSTSWFLGELAERLPQLLASEFVNGNLSALVGQATGRRATGVEEQLRAVPAPADVAEVLGVEENAPVIVGRQWFKDGDGYVLEYDESYTASWLEGRWGSAVQE